MRRALVLILFAGLLVAAALLDRRSGGSAGVDPGEIGFRFTESSGAAGIDFTHRVAAIDAQVQHAADHIMGVGASAAVSDVDGDGWMDVFLTNSDFEAPNALYRNRGDGTFVDIAERANLADLNQAEVGVCMGGLFADVENDGDVDLFVYRYGNTALLANDGSGVFEDRSESSNVERWMNSNAACWIDHDRDGLVDLYVAGYYRAEHDLWDLDTTKIMHDSGEFATNGGANVLLHNSGDFSFEDVTTEQGLTSTLWTFAVVSTDLNEDGWPDLYVANDYGSEECLLNRDGERFEDAPNVDLGHDSKSGMAVAVGNVKNDGRQSLFITNISSNGWIFHGNNLRTNLLPEGGGMRQTARGALVNTGWAWSAQFGDFDNDSFQDLFVVNGFISADPDRSYWYEAASLASGTGRIIEDASNWPDFDGRSQSGYERSHVLRNNRGRAFVDVAEKAGISDRLDGRAVVLADFENRGALDALIANQEAPALLYRNEPNPDNSWITLDLVGTASNRSAIGAEARVFGSDGSIQIQTVLAGSGFSSQNDPRLHFGLGPEPDSVRIEIRWPSGLRQELDTLELRRLHEIVEPPPNIADNG